MSDQSLEDRAREVTVLSGTEMILGMPIQMFMLVLILAFPTALLASWMVGGVIGGVGLYSMYQIHKEDPQAAQVWAARISSQVKRWRGGHKQGRDIILLP